MKPRQIVFFALSVLSVLLIIMIVFPKDGIKINNELKLEFITLGEFFSNDKQDSVDISEIIETNVIEEDTLDFKEEELLDSAYIDSVLIYYKPVPIQIDSVQQYIEFPAGDRKILFKLFEYMANLGTTNDLMRILHYGDSQIETDRMTSYFRYKLQNQFGGSGPGLLPAKQAYQYKSPMEVVPTDGWKRYVIFPRIDTMVTHKRYGVLGSFCRFSPIVLPDTTIKDSSFNVLDESLFEKPKTVYNESVTFLHSKYSFSNVKKFNKVKMFYGYNQASFSVKVSDGENLMFSDSLKPIEYLGIKTWDFTHTPEKLKISFSGTSSPEIYGFAFDAVRGIAVDNIPLRGCSGTIFTKMDLNLLKQMYDALNVRLLIMQFGGNTIPYMSEEKVAGYKRYFSSQLRTLKRICPYLSIIVVGPADMATKVKDSYETYPVLEQVIEALKQASFENDCAFWDMYRAMGGKNAMSSWVFAEPPLAEKDFVHFTPQGANIIAKMFYNAFINEYNYYLRNYHNK